MNHCYKACGNNTICTINPVYTCNCMPGYLSPTNDGRNCVLNQCSVNNGGCNQFCTFSFSGSYCSCKSTYTLSADQKTCIFTLCYDDVNGGCGFNSICSESSSGTKQCQCKSGYISSNGNGTGCASNACMANRTVCGPHTTCLPLNWQYYYCTCNDGYVSINSTAYGNCILCGSCTNMQVCYNQTGIPDCQCGSGLRLYWIDILYPCVPINGCTLSNGGCEHICNYISPGLYNCTCRDGYYLSNDGVTCISNAQQSSSSSVGIGVGVGLGLLILLIVLLVMLRRRKRQTIPTHTKTDSIERSL